MYRENIVSILNCSEKIFDSFHLVWSWKVRDQSGGTMVCPGVWESCRPGCSGIRDLLHFGFVSASSAKVAIVATAVRKALKKKRLSYGNLP